LPVRVLSRLFRRLFRRPFLQGLEALHAAGELQFFNDLTDLEDADAFRAHLAPLRNSEWVVFAKRPFAGPEQVLAYLARYALRLAISNRRLIAIDETHVSFRWKDYRENGRRRSKVMRLAAGEFMRRFLLHVLPDGFHRIRHYGLFASGHRAEKLARCRKLLEVAPTVNEEQGDDPPPCPCCGGRMKIIETFERGRMPRTNISIPRYDTS
jgi:hypothetical protein